MTEQTLNEFLLARIAEDEEVANEANERYDADTSLWVVDDDYRHDIVGASDKRVLAECEAKRTIVEQWDTWDGQVYDGWTNAAAVVLGTLAAIWSEHPDYREEWRP